MNTKKYSLIIVLSLSAGHLHSTTGLLSFIFGTNLYSSPGKALEVGLLGCVFVNFFIIRDSKTILDGAFHYYNHDITLLDVAKLPVELFKKIPLERIEEIRTQTKANTNTLYAFLRLVIQRYSSFAPEKCYHVVTWYLKRHSLNQRLINILLCEAAQQKSLTLFKFLLSIGAEVDSCHPRPIESAVINEDYEIFKTCIAHNASLDILDYTSAQSLGHNKIIRLADIIDHINLSQKKSNTLQYLINCILKDNEYGPILFNRLQHDSNNSLFIIYHLYKTLEEQNKTALLYALLEGLNCIDNKQLLLTLRRKGLPKNKEEYKENYITSKNLVNFKNYYNIKINYIKN